MKIVLCTDQGALFREYQELVKQMLPFVTLCKIGEFSSKLPEYPSSCTPITTYAMAQAGHLKLPVLVEEVFLIVPGLEQRYTCRLSIEEQSSSRKQLLDTLQEQSPFNRSAYMECLLTYAAPGKECMQFTGRCEGVLLEHEEGSGFAYEPIFRNHFYNQSFAQLQPHIKRAISGQSKALARFALWMESNLSARH